MPTFRPPWLPRSESALLAGGALVVIASLFFGSRWLRQQIFATVGSSTDAIDVRPSEVPIPPHSKGHSAQASSSVRVAHDEMSAVSAEAIASGKLAIPASEAVRLSRGSSGPNNVAVTTNGESCSPLKVTALSPTQYQLEADVDGSVGYWFMFNVRGAAGNTIRFDIPRQDGLDNWATLNPVVCDSARLDAAEDYADSPASHQMVVAHNGSNLPASAAASWRYIPDVWFSSPSVYSFNVTFTSDQATVAMRVPYTPGYERAFSTRAQQCRGIHVYDVGSSPKGRSLDIFTVGESDGVPTTKPTILIYAGEHADEHDAMWVASGALEFLAGADPEAKKLVQKAAFIVVPMLDPDADAAGQHNGIIDSFDSARTGNVSTEAVCYANWFQQWISRGNRIDLVLNLHNVQSMEAKHVSPALLFGLGRRHALSLAVNDALLDSCRDIHLSVTPKVAMTGWSPSRLGGWLAKRYGSLTLAYEVNSQEAGRHLSLSETKQLGARCVIGYGRFLSSRQAPILTNLVNQKLADRAQKVKLFGSLAGTTNALITEAQINASAESDSHSGAELLSKEKVVP